MATIPPLTPARLDALAKAPPAAGQIEVADGACPGLRIRISQGGTKTWVLGCRDNQGRARRFSIGAYPTIGIAEARKRARVKRQEVRDGADPTAEARAERQKHHDARHGIGTLDALLAAYAAQRGADMRTWAEANQRIRAVFREALDKPALDLTGPDLQRLADGHASASSASAAVRYLRPVLKWGERRRMVAAGLHAQIEQVSKPGRRARTLDHGELAAVLRGLDAEPNARCVRLILWTAARLDEAAGAVWREFDLDAGVWMIPPNRHKSGRGHSIVLPHQARAALADWRGDAGPDGYVFASRRGSPPGNWDRWTKALQAATGTSGWQRHDLRRTVATMAGRLGHAPHAIEALLGHLVGSSDPGINASLAGTYNRNRYSREAGEALQSVADELDRLTAGGGNVVRLRA